MIATAQVAKELADSQRVLTALLVRYHAGERTTVGHEARSRGDMLICLMEKAPLEQRQAIDILIDRYESLRASCLS